MFAGVDPSITNTGIVVLGTKGEILGCFNSSKRQNKRPPKSLNQELLRYEEIAVFTEASIRSCGEGPVFTAYENYSYNSVNLAFTIGELGGVLKLSLVKAFDALYLVEPLRVKKFATGIANVGKDEMIEQAKKEDSYFSNLNKKELTSDICDAYFLAKIAWYIGAPKSAAAKDPHRGLVRPRLTLIKDILQKEQYAHSDDR